jgi:hypothetical protein
MDMRLSKKPLAHGDMRNLDKPSLEQGSERPEARGSREHRDPFTGAPGAHPLGTALGASAGGIAAVAAAGTLAAGPVGAVIGTAVAAIAGGLAGKGIAEWVDPTAEDAYWRDEYAKQTYVDEGASYDDYGPAYRYGVASFTRMGERSFDDAQTDLMANWPQSSEGSRLDWSRAQHAVSAAWHRLAGRMRREHTARAAPTTPEMDEPRSDAAAGMTAYTSATDPSATDPRAGRDTFSENATTQLRPGEEKFGPMSDANPSSSRR